VREIARVLRPRGVLAILFNQTDGGLEPTLPQASRDALDALAVDRPPEYKSESGLWRAPFPGPFEPFTVLSFPNQVEYDREGLLARLSSWSQVAGLPDDERTPFIELLAEQIPDVSYIDSLRTELSLTRLVEGS
jgi:hypothetical protein